MLHFYWLCQWERLQYWFISLYSILLSWSDITSGVLYVGHVLSTIQILQASFYKLCTATVYYTYNIMELYSCICPKVNYYNSLLYSYVSIHVTNSISSSSSSRARVSTSSSGTNGIATCV